MTQSLTGTDRTAEAHAEIGGFLTRCSVLDYRAGQLISRWFCTGEKQRYLSYVLHGLDFEQKRQIIEERLTSYHPDPQGLRDTMAEATAVMERRRLVASGLLSSRRNGDLCVKSFAGARFLSDTESNDIIAVSALPEWSQRALRLTERVMALGEVFEPAGN